MSSDLPDYSNIIGCHNAKTMVLAKDGDAEGMKKYLETAVPEDIIEAVRKEAIFFWRMYNGNKRT